MAWLEDMLAQLQVGGAPAAFSPPPGAFPAMPAPVDEAAEAAAAREAAGARMIRSNQRRIDPFGMPDMNSAGVQLAMGQGPAGTGVPVEGSPQFTPMSMAGVPPSMQLASTMGKPPPQAPAPMAPQAPVPGLNSPVGGVGGGMPAAPGGGPVKSPGMMAQGEEDAMTDVGARRRSVDPMSIAPSKESSILDSLTGGRGLSGFGDKLRELSPHMIALGAGMAGEGWDKAAQVNLMQQKRGEATQQANLTAQALLARGAPAAEVAAAVKSPELLKAMIVKYFETKPAQNVNGRLVRENPDGTVRTLADYSDDKKPPSGFERTADGGLKYIKGGPNDPEYLREKGEKNAAPTGYRWVDPKDPEKGLVAIPGGPGEKVTPEVSARLGLAKSFLGQLPDIKRDIEAGAATGAWDATMALAGVGRPGELRRQIASGAEALLRNLTGAGMSHSEAQKYISRYELQPHDTAEKVISKLNQLERELNATITEVEKGRSSVPQNRSPAATAKGTVSVGGATIPWSIN